MNNTIGTPYDRSRTLSPVSKSKESFSGKLIILDNEKLFQDQELQGIRSEDERRKVTNRPSSGSLEVLKSDDTAKPTYSIKSDYPSQITRPLSGRELKNLPEVKRKDDDICTCQNDKDICGNCHSIRQQMKDLHIDGKKINHEQLQVNECKSNRAPVNHTSFDANTVEVQNTDYNAEENDSDNSTDEGSDDGQEGNDNNDNANSQSPQTHVAAKAPLELLGMFLSAIMKKDYENAQNLCNQILEVEPENETCLQFRNTLKEKLNQDAEEPEDESEDDTTEDEDESDDENSGDESDSSAEDSQSDDETDDELDKNIDISKLNLFMGGVPVRKGTKR